jgi:hypothetical protein
MGQIFAHDFKLDDVAESLKSAIQTSLKKDLPMNHHEILVKIAKRIIENERASQDFYKSGADESDDFLWISHGASYYAAEYLLKNDFAIADDYKHIVETILHDSSLETDTEEKTDNQLVNKFSRILKIQETGAKVYGGDETENVIELANQIKKIPFDKYLKLLRVFIVSLAHESNE